MRIIIMSTEYKTRLMAKKDFQQLRNDFKAQGFPVLKIDSGYILHLGDTLLLKAMNGSRGYLVRYKADLFE